MTRISPPQACFRNRAVALGSIVSVLIGIGPALAADPIETPKSVAQKCLLMIADLLPKAPGTTVIRVGMPTSVRTEFSIISGTTYFMVGDLVVSLLGQEITFDYQCRVLRGEPQQAFDGRKLSTFSGSAILAIRE